MVTTLHFGKGFVSFDIFDICKILQANVVCRTLQKMNSILRHGVEWRKLLQVISAEFFPHFVCNEGRNTARKFQTFPKFTVDFRCIRPVHFCLFDFNLD